MTNYALFNKIQETLRLADQVSASGVMPAGSMSLRDMLKFDYLLFLGFLYEPDGSDTMYERRFIMEYLSMVIDTGKFSYPVPISPQNVQPAPPLPQVPSRLGQVTGSAIGSL